MTALLRIPMFGFSLLAFLALGVIVAVACWLVFRSGEHGQNKLSTPAGCAIGCGLLGFAFVGALGFLAVCAIDWRAEALRNGPFKSLEFRWDRQRGAAAEEDDGRAEPMESEAHWPDADAGYRARLRVELRGSRDEVAQIVSRISNWLRENTEGEFSVSSTTTDAPAGRTTRIEWGLPIRADEVRELQRELEEELGALEIPDDVDVKVEVKEPEE